MTDTAAIYGFEFTRPFKAGGLRFEPVELDHHKAKALARDLSRHHLTGTVSADELTSESLFELTAILSFIEHLDVLISDPISHSDAAILPENMFDLALPPRRRNNGGGAVIGSDAFSPRQTSRQDFIDLAVPVMKDKTKGRLSGLPLLLYKSVETFKQRQPFMEITYFLLISGLETFCRNHQGDFTSKNAAEPIVRTLKHFGFNIEQNGSSHPARSMASYLHLRNALFHQGQFTRTINVNGANLILNCGDYLFHLSMLVSLTVMKAVGFDDGHTNWDCWIDRQLLK